MTLEGSWEGRVFDERELKFEVGDGESQGLPVGVEKAIAAMEQEEESFFTIKPKYVCFKPACRGDSVILTNGKAPHKFSSFTCLLFWSIPLH